MQISVLHVSITLYPRKMTRNNYAFESGSYTVQCTPLNATKIVQWTPLNRATSTRPFMALISVVRYYPASLLSKKIQICF